MSQPVWWSCRLLHGSESLIQKEWFCDSLELDMSFVLISSVMMKIILILLFSAGVILRLWGTTGRDTDDLNILEGISNYSGRTLIAEVLSWPMGQQFLAFVWEDDGVDVCGLYNGISLFARQIDIYRRHLQHS